jgi:hypothetical protein
MSTEGLKKKDIQRAVQKVKMGTAVSSKKLDASTTTDRIEMGFPGERITVVTTGDLAAQVQPVVGPANTGGAIAASTTPADSTVSTLFSAVTITRTSGEGTVIVLVK